MRRIAFFVPVLLLMLPCCGPDPATVGGTTAIIGAAAVEVEILEKKLTGRREEDVSGLQFTCGTLKGRRVVVASCGVGKVNAAMTAALLVDHFCPSEVIFTGIAGGINPDLLPGDIVIAAKTAQHDLGTLTDKGMKNWAARNPLTGRRNPLFIEADARLLKIAEEARGLTKFDDLVTSRGKRTPKVVRGVVVTGDVFVMSGAAKADLRKRLNADAVEMEGAAVAQVCYQLDVPCLVIRSLSDLADASAEADCERFYKMAAGNSAQFVMHMVELLGRR